MLYIRCPTCRTLLGDKQVYYKEELAKICKDCEMGKCSESEAEQRKIDLVNSIGLKRYCCKARLITYVDLVLIIK